MGVQEEGGIARKGREEHEEAGNTVKEEEIICPVFRPQVHPRCHNPNVCDAASLGQTLGAGASTVITVVHVMDFNDTSVWVTTARSNQSKSSWNGRNEN